MAEDKFDVRKYGSYNVARNRAERPAKCAKPHVDNVDEPESVTPVPKRKIGFKGSFFNRADVPKEINKLEEKIKDWISKREAALNSHVIATDIIYNNLSEDKQEWFRGLMKYDIKDLCSAPAEFREMYDTAEKLMQVPLVRRVNRLIIQYMFVMDECLAWENIALVEKVFKEYKKESDYKFNYFRSQMKKLKNEAKKINKKAQQYLDAIRDQTASNL